MYINLGYNLWQISWFIVFISWFIVNIPCISHVYSMYIPCISCFSLAMVIHGDPFPHFFSGDAISGEVIGCRELRVSGVGGEDLPGLSTGGAEKPKKVFK